MMALLAYLSIVIISFLKYSLNESIAYSILCVLILLLTTVMFLGGLINVSRGIHLLHIRASYPLLNKLSAWNITITTLVLGAIPWFLAICMGYIHDHYIHFGRHWALLLVIPVIFSPIFAAKYLGTTVIGVILASAFWLGVGLLVFFIYSINH